VRDRTDPGRIDPAYDGGDHVHFNPTGYQAVANAIPLAKLPSPACSPPVARRTHPPHRAIRHHRHTTRPNPARDPDIHDR
jgi:hypothetical protein